jgi:WD40 repeat protein/energy-coupling factor transporter ATP-binding protein EcfA2/cytoskeletal protein RodZ
MEPTPFPTLAELRAGHRELMQERRNESGVDGLDGRVRTFIERGQATGVFLDLEDERWEVQSLLDFWSNELYHLTQEDLNATLADYDPTLAPDLDDSLCPYIGLDPFDTAVQKLFFGREPLVRSMVERLEDGRFLALSGPSGSGKTSLVLAGLLPTLQTGALPESDKWLYLPPLVPGSDPIASLIRLLRTADNTSGWVTETTKQLLESPQTLTNLIERRAQGKTAVFVVDQFEEIFTLCQDQARRQAFMENVLHLAQSPDNKHLLILTMRTDLESNLLRTAEFHAAYAAAQLRVTTMNASELRQAIQQPAELVGLKFEQGVVEQLVSDVLGEPAALPLLQFCLLKLWGKRERNRVTWKAYGELGGGRDALANTADRLYNNLNPVEQRIARRTLLKMVRPTQGLDVVRNRVLRSQLYEPNEGPARVDYIIYHFVRERLIRLAPGDKPENDQLEIAHEALVRNWPRILGWLEEERVALRHRLRLTETAEQWDALERDESALLRGLVLAEAQQYADLNELEKAFVAASLTAVQREEMEREAARQRELEQARQSARRLALLVVALAFVFLLALGFALLARRNATLAQANAQIASDNAATAVANEEAAVEARGTAEGNAEIAAQNEATAESAQAAAEANAGAAATAGAEANTQRAIAEAEREIAEQNALAAINARATAEANETLAERIARLATARELAAASLAQLGSDPQLSLLLALEAVNMTTAAGEPPPAEATDALYRAVRASQQLFTLAGHTGPVNEAAVSPDGRWLATASEDNSLKIWDAATGQEVLTLTGHNAPVTSLAFSPDNTHLVSGSSDSRLMVWDVLAGTRLQALVGQNDGSVRAVAFHPDGERVAASYEAGTARVWNYVTGDPLLRQSEHRGPVYDIEFTPDGSEFATAGEDGRIVVQNTATGIPVTSFAPDFDEAGFPVPTYGIAYSQDGTRLAAAKGNGLARILELASGTLMATLPGHSGAVTAVAFSPDGTRLATAGADSSAKVWDLETNRAILTLSGHMGELTSVGFYPSGERLVTGSLDNTGRVWNTAAGLEPLLLTDHRAGVNGLRYNQEGTAVATTSLDQSVRVWDTSSGGVLNLLTALPNPVNKAAFHPTKPILAVAAQDTVVRLFDLMTNQVLEPLYFQEDTVNDLAFNADGSMLATAGNDALVRLWDTETNEVIAELTHDGPVNTVAFSNDGSWVAATSGETAVIWNVDTGETMHTISGHNGLIHHATFNPEGDLLGTAGADGVVKLWDLETGEAIRTLSGHTGPVLWLAFNGDGTQLATGSVDKTARLWDVNTGQVLRTILGHTSAVTAVAFNPDGTELATASLDGTARITPLTTINDLLAQGWGRLARPLSPAECRQYLRDQLCLTADITGPAPSLAP